MGRAGFAYGQARLQAHYGRLADAAAWSRLERVSDFGQAVQVARGTPLRPWLEHVGPGSGAHEIELALRHRYRRHVDQVAGWFPRAWQPAIAWAAVAADLEVAAHLLAGRPPLPWMQHDPWYRPTVTAPEGDGRGAFRGSRLAPLAGGGPGRIPAAWRGHWRSLWPPVSGRVSDVLDELGRVLVAPVPASGEARLLNGHFRREAQRPGAVFAYLGLAYREMERLRGLLLRRLLLPRVA